MNEQDYDNSSVKVYSISTLMRQSKAWLVDQVRLLEKLHQDDEWQIDNQAKNCEKLLSEKDKRIQELETELSHREEDLVHADEKVFYREVAVKLEGDKIKQQAVREFAKELKERCYMVRNSTFDTVRVVGVLTIESLLTELYGADR